MASLKFTEEQPQILRLTTPERNDVRGSVRSEPQPVLCCELQAQGASIAVVIVHLRQNSKQPGPEGPVNVHFFRGMKPSAPSGSCDLQL